MDIQREKEFVSQYHYDARNFEWEKENGIPETKVDVNFQLINRDQEQNTTSLIVILSYMIVFDGLHLLLFQGCHFLFPTQNYEHHSGIG